MCNLRMSQFLQSTRGKYLLGGICTVLGFVGIIMMFLGCPISTGHSRCNGLGISGIVIFIFGVVSTLVILIYYCDSSGPTNQYILPMYHSRIDNYSRV